MGRCVGMDVHRDFAQIAVVEDGLVRDEGRIGVTPHKVDARILAQLLAADFLPPVWLPDDRTRMLRRQAARRTHLVRQRTRLKNQVHAILNRNLVPRQQDYAFARPSLVAHKRRKLELRAGQPSAEATDAASRTTTTTSSSAATNVNLWNRPNRPMPLSSPTGNPNRRPRLDDFIRGVHDLADHGRVGQEGDELLPGVAPQGHDPRVAIPVLELKDVEGVGRRRH